MSGTKRQEPLTTDSAQERILGAIVFLAAIALLVPTLWSDHPPRHAAAVFAGAVGVGGLWFGLRLFGGTDAPDDDLSLLDVSSLLDE